MTIAPMSAPSSGRRSRRVARETVTRRSSTGASVVADTGVPPCAVVSGAGGAPPAPDAGSASAGRSQLPDLLCVVLRHEAGAGVHRLPAAQHVPVDLVE